MNGRMREDMLQQREERPYLYLSRTLREFSIALKHGQCTEADYLLMFQTVQWFLL